MSESFIKSTRIETGQGALAASIFTPEPSRAPTPAPLVLCAHGLTGTRIGSCYRFVRLGRALAARGIACLTFDFRGCGESDGAFIDVTCDRLQADLSVVVAWAQGRPEFDATRIGLCGSSFGAFTAARVAPAIGGLRALVFWAPVARPRLLFDRVMTDGAWALLESQGWLEHRGMPLGRGFFDVAPEDDDGPAALARAASPLRIYHGAGDSEVPIEHGRRYAAALNAAGTFVELIEIDASDHGMRDVAANETIVAGSVDWFVRFLFGDEAGGPLPARR